MSTNVDNKVYVLDTNILIGYWLWCPFQFSYDFWNKLEKFLEDSRWILLDVVADEIIHNPELQQWVKRQKEKGLVTNIDDKVLERAVEINEEYPMINEETGNSRADTYIVAYAEINKLSIFTRESFRDSESELFKIPDVCRELRIECIKNPVVFMRDMNFNLSKRLTLSN